MDRRARWRDLAASASELVEALEDQPDEEALRAQVDQLAGRVLNGLLLYVGTGDGVLGSRAIDGAGSSLRVVMTVISPALMSHAKARARERGVAAQCEFIEGSAECLVGRPTPR